MTFHNLLGDRIDVYRMAKLTGDKTGYQTMTTSLICNIRLTEPSKAVQFGGAVGQLYTFYLEADANIEVGDQIRDDDGNVYQIEAGGVDFLTNIGSGNVNHIEVIARKVE